MKILRWMLFYFLLTACIDPIDFDVPPVDYMMVVDGMISDESGPYTVKLYKARPLNNYPGFQAPITKAKVILICDDGSEDSMTEMDSGTYVTHFIQGEIGKRYHLRIETRNGLVYESEPERIEPVGSIESIHYEFEANSEIKNGIRTNKDHFNVFVDAQGLNSSENYIRWRTVGTYEVETFPQFFSDQYQPSPLECSGYEFSAGILYPARPCTCCKCWVNDYDEIPNVSDGQFVSEGNFKHIQIATVPVTRRTFYDKYHIEVQQMSLSQKAFTYFKLIKAQKEGATSLFQPPLAKLRSNIHRQDSDEEVQGYFLATSIKRKSIFITRDDVPYRVQAIDTLAYGCTIYKNSTTIKPYYWQ